MFKKIGILILVSVGLAACGEPRLQDQILGTWVDQQGVESVEFYDNGNTVQSNGTNRIAARYTWIAPDTMVVDLGYLKMRVGVTLNGDELRLTPTEGDALVYMRANAPVAADSTDALF